MLRRFLVISIRRSFVILVLVCLGCVAQSAPPEVYRKIERQVRSYYNIPPEMKVTVGDITASTDWPGYDGVLVTIDSGEGKKQELKLLIAKDRNTMVRLTKFDLTKDPFAEVMNKIDVNGRPTRGAKSAKVVVVNFDDFECPYCAAMHHTLFPELLKEYGDRVIVYLQGLSAGGDSSVGDSCSGGCELPGRARHGRVLGFRGQHSRQQAGCG